MVERFNSYEPKRPQRPAPTHPLSHNPLFHNIGQLPGLHLDPITNSSLNTKLRPYNRCNVTNGGKAGIQNNSMMSRVAVGVRKQNDRQQTVHVFEPHQPSADGPDDACLPEPTYRPVVDRERKMAPMKDVGRWRDYVAEVKDVRKSRIPRDCFI